MGFIHPTKLAIVEAMSWLERPLSISELELILESGDRCPALAYHLNSLASFELLEQTETRRARGSTEPYFYFWRATA